MILTIASFLVLFSLPVMAYLALKQPGYAFALVIPMYAIEQVLLQNRTGFPISGIAVNLFVGIICTLAIGLAIGRGDLKGVRLPPTAVAAYALLLYAAVTLLWVPNERKAVNTFRDMIPYLGTYALLAPFCVADRTQIRKFVFAMIFLGGFVALGLAFSRASNRFIEVSAGAGKVELLNPLAAGSFGGHLLICILFALYQFEMHLVKKGAMLVVALIALYVVAQSGSRGQLVALLLTCLLWVPITAKITARRSFATVYILVAALGAVGYLFLDRLDLLYRFNSEHVRTGTLGRFDMALNLLERTYKDGPVTMLFGLGNSSSYHYIGFYPHIVPLEVLAEEGVLGFILLCVFTIGFFLKSRSVINNPLIDPVSRAECCLIAALFSFDALLTLKQGSLLGSPRFFCFGIAGLILMNQQFPRRLVETVHQYQLSRPAT